MENSRIELNELKIENVIGRLLEVQNVLKHITKAESQNRLQELSQTALDWLNPALTQLEEVSKEMRTGVTV